MKGKVFFILFEYIVFTVFAILNTTSAPKYSLQNIHIFTQLSKIWPLLLWLVLLFLSYLSFPSFLLSYLKISFLERSNWNWNYFGTPGSFQYWVISWGCEGALQPVNLHCSQGSCCAPH